MSSSILIAGVGNIFLGDDAFGVETAHALTLRQLPDGVKVVDYGIRGFDLAYALLDPWDAVILVDALPRGGSAGTLYLLEPDLSSMKGSQSAEMAMNPHGMDPVHVLHLAFSLGEVSAKVYVVGCEPADFGDELQGRMGLSETVQASVERAVSMVEDLVERILAEAKMSSAQAV
jgi:hydrogenase maturation protease